MAEVGVLGRMGCQRRTVGVGDDSVPDEQALKMKALAMKISGIIKNIFFIY
ncbi:MAG: hypothetical protein IPN58_21390 [Anaerolineales bacterium]|nr:hypothetical protein [Anaerolineales bacterium]